MKHTSSELPSVLDRLPPIAERLVGKKPAVFLDYDGTLTPIVERPELAVLSRSMRTAIAALAKRCPVAVISGRDRRDVEELVELPELVFAGSHGFDISGPGGKHLEFSGGAQYLPDLDRAEEGLRRKLKNFPGVQIERKRFALAVHFRRSPPGKIGDIENIVEEVQEKSAGRLRRTGGKKIFELRPALDWDKGRAVAWLLEQLELDGPDVLPFYLGDDETDEDAFRELGDRGIGILVRDEERPTSADYALDDTVEVRIFLEKFAELLKGPDR